MTSTGDFALRMFYTVPSRLIRHRLRLRLYDDDAHLDVFVGGTHLLTPATRAARIQWQARSGRDFRQVIHSLRFAIWSSGIGRYPARSDDFDGYANICWRRRPAGSWSTCSLPEAGSAVPSRCAWSSYSIERSNCQTTTPLWSCRASP